VIGVSVSGSPHEVVEGAPQLWCAPLDLPTSVLGVLASWLSEDERARAARHRRSIDRDRLQAARGWLRLLLGWQLGVEPGTVEFAYAKGGKPHLGEDTLRFSLSRSGGVALFGLARGAEIGVDIERVRTNADIDDIAARFFSAAEQTALAALADGERLEASFECWTRKEAYVKALGVGIGAPLDTFDAWGNGASPVDVGGWWIHRVSVPRGFTAAVAVEGLDQWTPAPPRPLRSPSLMRTTVSIEH
jgi:4'-phosphopantetheinyl transferase